MGSVPVNIVRVAVTKLFLKSVLPGGRVKAGIFWVGGETKLKLMPKLYCKRFRPCLRIEEKGGGKKKIMEEPSGSVPRMATDHLGVDHVVMEVI